MNRKDFMKSFALGLLGGVFFRGKLKAAGPPSVIWKISEDCTNCGICYEDDPDNWYENEDENAARFKQGMYFYATWWGDVYAINERGYYWDVAEMAARCPAEAILEDVA